MEQSWLTEIMLLFLLYILICTNFLLSIMLYEEFKQNNYIYGFMFIIIIILLNYTTMNNFLRRAITGKYE